MRGTYSEDVDRATIRVAAMRAVRSNIDEVRWVFNRSICPFWRRPLCPQTRSFGHVGSMSGLPESGHGWVIYEYTL